MKVGECVGAADAGGGAVDLFPLKVVFVTVQ